MNKRDFLKTSLLAGTGILAAKTISASENNFSENKKTEKRHWVWENPDSRESDDELKKNTAAFTKPASGGFFLKPTANVISGLQKRPDWRRTAGCGQ